MLKPVALGPVPTLLGALRAIAQVFRKGWVPVFAGCVFWAFALWIIWAYLGITGIHVGP